MLRVVESPALFVQKLISVNQRILVFLLVVFKHLLRWNYRVILSHGVWLGFLDVQHLYHWVADVLDWLESCLLLYKIFIDIWRDEVLVLEPRFFGNSVGYFRPSGFSFFDDHVLSYLALDLVRAGFEALPLFSQEFDVLRRQYTGRDRCSFARLRGNRLHLYRLTSIVSRGLLLQTIRAFWNGRLVKRLTLQAGGCEQGCIAL